MYSDGGNAAGVCYCANISVHAVFKCDAGKREQTSLLLFKIKIGIGSVIEFAVNDKISDENKRIGIGLVSVKREFSDQICCGVDTVSGETLRFYRIKTTAYAVIFTSQGVSVPSA